MRLSQLIDVSVIQRLAQANYDANGMPVGIVDAIDGSVLVACGWQDICLQFHRAHPGSLARCRESDAYIKGRLPEATRCEYQCRNGLRHIGIPIIVAGEHLATLFLSQFLYEGEAADRAFFVEQARELGYDEQRYLAALDRIPRFSRRAVENILAYDAALARFIADLAEGARERVLHEQALRASEERAASLARFPEENPEPVLRLDREGAVLYANAAARRALAAIGGVEIGRAAPHALRAPADDACANERSVTCEVPCGERTLALSFCPSSADVSVYGRDITERKLAEDALRRSEEQARARAVQLEAVLDCIADGVIVYDRHGRTIRSSPAAAQILQLPPGEGFFPDVDRVIARYELRAEDGRRLGRDEMVAVRSAVHGEKVRGVVQQVRLGEGEPRWVMMSGTPLIVAGEHTGAVVSLTDVTERKHAEEELAVVSRLYAVLSRVNEAIVRIRDEAALYEETCRIVAEEGGFPLVWVGVLCGREVTPTAAWGPATAYLRDIRVEIDGELGQGPIGTCLREDRPVIDADFEANPTTRPWHRAARAHGLRAATAFPLHRRGKVVAALTFYAARRGAFTQKQVGLLESLCADVSYALDAMDQERLRTEAERALREREQALRDADRRKDEFLGMLSHELRNPLAPIANSIYILDHADPGSEQARRARAVIRRQTEHLKRLVDDLLDVTRIARGKIELRRERVDLCEVVRRAADDHRSGIVERGVRLQVDVPERRAWVEGDPTRLSQIVGNLLHNAAKFTPAGGAVTVSVREGPDAVEAAVVDTGIGIEPELLPLLFEPFVQGDRSLARTEGGLGLGLALVKGIAEMHGGTVRAESPGRGGGAGFTVRLPPAAPDTSTSDRARGAAPRSRGRQVLVVDDNRDAAESLADFVELLGHTVEIAYDGPEAIARARANPPDVVLCDIGLPGMSGYEVARALRGCVERARLIAVSGYAQPEDLRKAAEAGFDGHIAKPADIDQITRVFE